MRVYIAGQVTDRTDDELEVFFDAEKKLLDTGFTVVNPVTLCRNAGITDWIPCMALCLDEVTKCSMVFMLQNWEDSNGAKLERAFAIRQGILVVYQGV